MPKKRKAEAKEEDVRDEPGPALGLSEYEKQRLEIIARNRERLLALGIPGLVKQLQATVEAAAPPKKKAKKAAGEGRGEYKPRVKKEPGAEERPTRRSSRLREAAEHPKPKEEKAEERFERELGGFVVEGACPRCGRELQRGHRAHLEACSGRPARAAGAPRPRDAAMAELTEEERRDAKKRLLARMKHVSLDGLVEFTPEAAKFVVLGSKGDPYHITLKDGKHTCTCLDYRFRRHNCKHICAALDHLGIMESPERWRPAVEAQLDKLVQEAAERHAHDAPPPVNRAAEMAERFLD